MTDTAAPSHDDVQLAQLRRAAEISMRMIEFVDSHLSSSEDRPTPAALADLNHILDRACRTLRRNIALERRERAEAEGRLKIAVREQAHRQQIEDARNLQAAQQRGIAAKRAARPVMERLIEAENLHDAIFEDPDAEDLEDGEASNLLDAWMEPDGFDQDFDGVPTGAIVAEAFHDLDAAIDWSRHLDEPWGRDALDWAPGDDETPRPPRIDLDDLKLWRDDPDPAPEKLAEASAAWRYHCQHGVGKKPEPPE